MRVFFTNLLAMCNIRPAAKPAKAKECEFCGGVRCFGACGAEGAVGKANFCGRFFPRDGNESRFACDDGMTLLFQRDSQIGRDIVSACPDEARYRITVTVDNGVITEFFSAERLRPAASSFPVSLRADGP